MDYHTKTKEELEEKTKEVEKLKRLLKQYQVYDEEKIRRITYLENITTYLENKLASSRRL